MPTRAQDSVAVKVATAVVIVGGLLAGCANPYALGLSKINYAASQKAGVIQFTDPKLYKREALINERRAELGYLDDLLKASAKPEFKIEPEIVRELEVIRAFSAAVGLKFDPAAAIESRRATEIGDIEQRIQVTRLEMQLAQLTRDAELLRDRLAGQSAPSVTPAASGTTVTKPPAGPTPEDVTKILTSVEALRKSVEGRLDRKAEPPVKSSGAASPVEEFRDRRAYRDAIKDAVNAASLDELHDMDGNSLFRVQLQATALPEDGDHVDTLGILRMEVVPPTMDPDTVRRLYHEWLWYVNQSLNVSPPDTTRPLKQQQLSSDPRLFTLGEGADLFTIVQLEIAKTPATAQDCNGVHDTARDVEKCWYLRIALPGRPGTGYSKAAFVLDLAMQSAPTVAQSLGVAVEATRRPNAAPAFTLDASCRRVVAAKGATVDLGPSALPGFTATDAFALARTVHTVWAQAGNTLSYVADIPLDDPVAKASLSDGVRQALRKLNVVRTQARAFLAALEAVSPACRGQLVEVEPSEVPEGFSSAVRDGQAASGRITVYDVAPTERTQRVSTAARAADAVAMAAALAGQLPQAGFGGSGNFAFTRTAIGKADALERAPLVVGFAEPAQNAGGAPRYPAFGWLLGPKVTLDPKKQRLVLQQHLAPYEIHADISLPGWWPHFDLKATTAWAPNWRTANQLGTTLALGESNHERRLRVPMRHSAGDMDGLTAVILRRSTGQQIDRPRIRRVDPAILSACAGQVTIVVVGEGVWRTSAVHIGGGPIEANNIRVLPDMQGVAVTVDVGKIPVVGKDRTASITVWTHNGSDVASLTLTDVRRADGTCAGATMAAPSTIPTIVEVVPAKISLCERKAVFTVHGKNLGTPLAAALGTVPARARDIPPGDGTLIEVEVMLSDREHKIGKLADLPLIVRTATGAASRPVTIVASDCPPEPVTAGSSPSSDRSMTVRSP
jgi:hypothetical protein